MNRRLFLKSLAASAGAALLLPLRWLLPGKERPDESNCKPGSGPVNYNARTREPLRAIFKWRDGHGVQMRVFENYDGGGFNYYIVEFPARADLDRFMLAFPVVGRPWAEDGQSRHMELDGALERRAA